MPEEGGKDNMSTEQSREPSGGATPEGGVTQPKPAKLKTVLEWATEGVRPIEETRERLPASGGVVIEHPTKEKGKVEPEIQKPLTPEDIEKAFTNALDKAKKAEQSGDWNWERITGLAAILGWATDEIQELKTAFGDRTPSPEEAARILTGKKEKPTPKEPERVKPASQEPETVKPKEDEDYSKLSYAELRLKLKNEKDEGKRQRLREEKFKRAKDVVEKGYYDLSQGHLEKNITDTLMASDVDSFDTNLRELADNAEREARANNEYKNNERLVGSIYDIVRGEVDEARLTVYLGLSDAELDARNLNKEGLKRESENLANSRLGLTNVIQPAGYLQAEPTEELLNEYASRNIPGAEAKLRRFQRDRQAREERERIERERIAAQAATGEGRGRGRERWAQPSQIRDYMGAVFETSDVRQYVYDYEFDRDMVPVLDITKPIDRDIWALENMRVFNNGQVAGPEDSWHPILEYWLSDMKKSYQRAVTAEIIEKKDKAEVEKGVLQTEALLKGMMAVSASARAMEKSGGAGAKYASIVAPPEPGGRGADLDKQDHWRDVLLHENPEAYNRVIDNPLVQHYYQMLLKDAGVTVIKEPGEIINKEGRRVRTNDSTESSLISIPDLDKARKGRLVSFLKNKAVKDETKGARGGGFDGWIADTISHENQIAGGQGNNDTIRWAAAKLACDAFLVDKYTRWEFNIDILGKGGLYPTQKWGGDPLRSVLQPSFLTGDVKQMYSDSDEDEIILNMIDYAFCPEDILGRNGSLVQASMVGGLKNYARYSDALYSLLGGSRGAGIAEWNKDSMSSLNDMTELIHLVTRAAKDVKGKNIDADAASGAILARVLQCKALALTMESQKPGFRDHLDLLFDSEGKNMPFKEVLQFLWGPHMDGRSGFLSAKAGARTRFKFNKWDAQATLDETKELLRYNNQDPQGRGIEKAYNIFGFFLDGVQAANKNFGRR